MGKTKVLIIGAGHMGSIVLDRCKSLHVATQNVERLSKAVKCMQPTAEEATESLRKLGVAMRSVEQTQIDKRRRRDLLQPGATAPVSRIRRPNVVMKKEPHWVGETWRRKGKR